MTHYSSVIIDEKTMKKRVFFTFPITGVSLQEIRDSLIISERPLHTGTDPFCVMETSGYEGKRIYPESPATEPAQ